MSSPSQGSYSLVLAELYKYNPSALIELYEVDLTPLQEYYTSKGAPIATTKYRFHNGVNQNLSNIVWDSQSYEYRAIQIDGVQASSGGEVPRPTLSIGNLDLRFTQLCRSNANLIGTKVTRIRTFVKFLDSSNFPTTNLLLNTENFSLWSTLGFISVTNNAIIAPNGTLTADKIYESANTSPDQPHAIYRTITGVPDNTKICFSVYLKAAERQYATVLIQDKNTTATLNGKTFDLLNGTVSSLTRNSVLNSGITPVGNGWYRCWVVANSATGTSAVTTRVYTDSDNNPNGLVYAGTLNSGVYVWGAQAEYITNPTNTPSVYVPVGTVAGNPTADPNAKFPDDVYTIDRMAEEIPGQITFELAPAWDVEGVMLPRRQIVANVCPWTYKKDACTWAVNGVVSGTVTGTAVAGTLTYTGVTTTSNGSGTGARLNISRSGGVYTVTGVYTTGTGYAASEVLTVLGTSLGGTITNNLTFTLTAVTGAKYYDANDLIVSTAAQDSCGKRLNSCRLRFGTRVLPFGGFPSAGLYGKPI